MKSTKSVLAVAIVIAGFASWGCGSDSSGSVSLADAFDECNLFEILDTGEPLSDGLFNAGVIQADALRDDGDFVKALHQICDDLGFDMMDG